MFIYINISVFSSLQNKTLKSCSYAQRCEEALSEFNVNLPTQNLLSFSTFSAVAKTNQVWRTKTKTEFTLRKKFVNFDSKKSFSQKIIQFLINFLWLFFYLFFRAGEDGVASLPPAFTGAGRRVTRESFCDRDQISHCSQVSFYFVFLARSSVWKFYLTFFLRKRLMAAYDECDSEKDKEILLRDIRFGSGLTYVLF